MESDWKATLDALMKGRDLELHRVVVPLMIQQVASALLVLKESIAYVKTQREKLGELAAICDVVSEDLTQTISIMDTQHSQFSKDIQMKTEFKVKLEETLAELRVRLSFVCNKYLHGP